MLRWKHKLKQEKLCSETMQYNKIVFLPISLHTSNNFGNDMGPAAMGSPVSPIVANIFMQWFEETALDTFPYEITLWKRYVDDTIVVLMDELLEDFTAHINAIHPAIRFTREEEEAGVIAVLDAKIMRKEDRSLSFSVYRKPTHTDHYLQFGSNQRCNTNWGSSGRWFVSFHLYIIRLFHLSKRLVLNPLRLKDTSF